MFPDGSNSGEVQSAASNQLEALSGGMLQGLTPVGQDDAEAFINDPSNLQALSGQTHRQRDAAALEALLAATPSGKPDYPTVQCPKCGTLNKLHSHNSVCKNCGTSLQAGAAEVATDDNPGESPFVGNAFAQAGAEQTLLLASEDDHPSTVKCPICKTENPWSSDKCKKCGMSLKPAKQKLLNASADAAIEMTLHLSAQELTDLDLAESAGQRQQWAKEGKALPDGSWPIPDVAHLKKAIQAFPGRAKGQVGRIKKWIMRRANALGYSGPDLDKVKNVSLNATADDEHNASVVALKLDHTTASDGLIWKVLCKTGTLALSPGPGQMDMDRPLNLTPDIFLAAKNAYDERAFEHVTIPETHNNGTLENTGTIDHLDILNKDQALSDPRLSDATKATFSQDPGDTLYMLGGMRFTDPKVREKAAQGSILNCSVGLKFNYRNKRTGKTYPVALEHVALTNQPWVDGLGAFGGTDMSLPFDQESQTPWDGVFAMPSRTETQPQNVEGVQTSSTPSLPTIPEKATLSQAMHGENDTQTPTLEMVLAQQQATMERQARELQEANERLNMSQSQLVEQGRQLHTAQTHARVAELAKMGVTPAVLKRYQEIALAQYEADATGGALQLSVKDGDSTKLQEFNAMDVADYLLAAMPRGDGAENQYQLSQSVAADALRLSQETTEKLELSTEQKADEVERMVHPERFDSEGKRIAHNNNGSGS